MFTAVTQCSIHVHAYHGIQLVQLPSCQFLLDNPCTLMENVGLDNVGYGRFWMPLMADIIKHHWIFGGTHEDWRHVNGCQLPANWQNLVYKRLPVRVFQLHFLQQQKNQSHQMTIL